MRILVIIPVCVFLLCSCASLLNQPKVPLIVRSEKGPAEICINNDKSDWRKVPTVIDAERSEKDLVIYVRADSIQRTIKIERRLSKTYLLFNIYTYGIGYIIDHNSPKRFSYPSNIYIDPFRPEGYYTPKDLRWDKTAPGKNLFSMKFFIPEGNHFYLNKGSGYGNAFGFLGISAGIEYYLSDRMYINTDIGTLTDFLIPLPAPVDYLGPYNNSFAVYADLQIGKLFRKFHSDLGIQFTGSSYYERETLEVFPEYNDTLRNYKIQDNAGFPLSAYYRITSVLIPCS